MYPANILVILTFVCITLGCGKGKPPAQEQIPHHLRENRNVVYIDKPCVCQECPKCPDQSNLMPVSENCTNLSMFMCLSECRKKLVDILDNCYRDPNNFVPYQQTETGRALYLVKVKDCISIDEFKSYQAGEEICETICRGNKHSP